MSESLLRKNEVCQMVTLSYPSIWRLMRAGKFPRAIQISPGRIAWRRSDVEAWVEKQAVAK